MGALVSPDSADALERALSSGSQASLALETDDGRYLVRVDRILYVKRFRRESRVGFGA